MTADEKEVMKRQIAEVEEEIAWLHFASTAAVNSSLPPIKRILAREQAALAELKRGMR